MAGVLASRSIFHPPNISRIIMSDAGFILSLRFQQTPNYKYKNGILEILNQYH